MARKIVKRFKVKKKPRKKKKLKKPDKGEQTNNLIKEMDKDLEKM